jgi:hypothetical protein
MRFEIAKADAEELAENSGYEFDVFQLPGRHEDDPDEDYVAVRPTEVLLMTLAQDLYLLNDEPAQAIDILNRIMLQIFSAEDIYEALKESGEYDDAGDGDGTLSAEGLNLVRTNSRLKHRVSSRRDPVGIATVSEIAADYITGWSGKDQSGKPQDFLPPSKPTGRASKRTSSSRKGSTRSTSSVKSASRAS